MEATASAIDTPKKDKTRPHPCLAWHHEERKQQGWRLNSPFDDMRDNRNTNLTAWLSDPRGQDYFGRTFAVRAAVLAHLLTGEGTLADVAREHGVSRQAVHRHYRRAVKVYGPPSTVS